MTYIYPAVFHPEVEGGYFISFPDLEGCFTQSETLEDGLDQAEDALNLMLWDMEERRVPIPAPSDARTLKAAPGDYVTLIKADTLQYRRANDTRAVKKTLSIPSWLNTLAVDNNINFSNVLQKALMKELGVHS